MIKKYGLFTIHFSIMSMVLAMHAMAYQWYTLFSKEFHVKYPYHRVGNQNTLQLEMYIHFLQSVNTKGTILILNM
jgi:hypothetical protein